MALMSLRELAHRYMHILVLNRPRAAPEMITFVALSHFAVIMCSHISYNCDAIATDLMHNCYYLMIKKKTLTATQYASFTNHIKTCFSSLI